MASKAEDDVSSTPIDAEVRRGVDRSHQLVAEVERLAHNLNVHLDEVQRLIADRRKTL